MPAAVHIGGVFAFGAVLSLMVLSFVFDKGAGTDTVLHTRMMMHVSMARPPPPPPSPSRPPCVASAASAPSSPSTLVSAPSNARKLRPQVATAKHLCYLFADPWIPVRFTPWGTTVQIIRYV